MCELSYATAASVPPTAAKIHDTVDLLETFQLHSELRPALQSVWQINSDLPCDLPCAASQPIIDQQGLGLRGLVHKEAHPVIPDLH